ncbi:MAG: DUF4230 domain-containing protein [Planctomycetota bacterium]|nr:DUF4230 domain-containing protein [Planctomycetota bacterium]
MTQTLALVFVSLLAGVLMVAVLLLLIRRKAAAAPVTEVRMHTVAERIRAVGKIVGLEVHAKEIATSTRGWAWVPPILLSQAKIAMIFNFEKQYFVDLSLLRPGDVELLDPVGPGNDRARYRVILPVIEGALRLTDVAPYDIQAGRILGLVDVIPMNADTQRALMQAAQEQASELFRRSEAKYIESARRSIEQHLHSLLHLFDVDVAIAWRDQPTPGAAPARLDLTESMTARLAERR